MSLEIFDLCERLEQALADLYRRYAELCPEYSRFWLHLSAEEEEHASWLRSLGVLVNNGLLSFDSARFKPKAVETSLAYVYELLAKAGKTPPDMIRFLSVAMDMEQSILEKGFYKLVKEDGHEMSEIFRELSTSSDRHFKAVKNLRDRIATSKAPSGT